MLSVMRMSSTKLGSGMTSMTTTATTAKGSASIPKVVDLGIARVDVMSANGLPFIDGVTVCPGRSLTGRWPSWLVVPNGPRPQQLSFMRPSCGCRREPAGLASAGKGKRVGVPRPDRATPVPRRRSRRLRKGPAPQVGSRRWERPARGPRFGSQGRPRRRPLSRPGGSVLGAVVSAGRPRSGLGSPRRRRRERPQPGSASGKGACGGAESPSDLWVAFGLTHLPADLLPASSSWSR